MFSSNYKVFGTSLYARYICYVCMFAVTREENIEVSHAFYYILRRMKKKCSDTLDVNNKTFRKGIRTIVLIGENLRVTDE